MRTSVPGWVGSSSIKWLGRIQGSTEPLWTRNNSTSYMLIGDEFPRGQSSRAAVTTQTIKSALALSWPADLSAGPHQIYGYAQSPRGLIEKVEWSMDGGAIWRVAASVEPKFQYSWGRFLIDLELRPGMYTILTRATDAAGNTQPSPPFQRERLPVQPAGAAPAPGLLNPQEVARHCGAVGRVANLRVANACGLSQGNPQGFGCRRDDGEAPRPVARSEAAEVRPLVCCPAGLGRSVSGP